MNKLSVIDVVVSTIEVPPGFELLSYDQQRGLLDLLQGAINVMVAHQNDPERGDVGWRKQTFEEQLRRAYQHAIEAYKPLFVSESSAEEQPTDDDGLPHVDHATARIALYYAKKRLLKKCTVRF